MRIANIVKVSLVTLTLLAAVASGATLNVPGDYSTIQAAINAAGPGDTVQIAAGTYQESLGGWRDIEVFKSVNVVGAGSGQTVVELSGLQHGVAIHPDATGQVLVEGITFTKQTANTKSADWAILVGETGGIFQSLTFRDVEVAYAQARNVHLANATYQNVAIASCNIHDAGAWGFSCAGTVNAMTVTDSHFDNNGWNNPGYGIGFDLTGPSSTNVAITGGTFNGNKHAGINLMRVSGALISGVAANSNAGSPGGGFGIKIDEWASVTQNVTIERSTAQFNGLDGITLQPELPNSIRDITITCCLLSQNGRNGLNVSYITGGALPYPSVSNVVVSQSSLLTNGSNGLGVNSWWVAIPISDTIVAEYNWWGDASGPAGVGPGSGDAVTNNVDYDPWLSDRPLCGDDLLYLDANDASLYVKTGETVTIDLAVANLQQMVNGCQALLGYSSLYFPAAGTVAPGGGDWDELIYNVWRASLGELDTAIGVTLTGGPSGTDDDGKVAVITLTAGTTEGTTQMVFRADGEQGYATMLSDLSANPVWPTKLDSQTIVIDGTPPEITCPDDVTEDAEAGKCEATGIDLGMASATDELAGVASITNDAPAVFPKGETTVTWTATDKAGNVATCEQVVTIEDNEDPVIVACPADIEVSADPGVCQATLVFEEPFDSDPTLSTNQAPNAWYVDRYAPAGFVSADLNGRQCLKHSISSADSYANRTGGYKSAFYNTQGRKYDVNLAVPGTIQVDLYIPADWENDARRADLWATTMDSSGAISGYPIAGFIDNDPDDAMNPNPAVANLVPRFRAWMDEGAGGWIDLGLPDGFVYDEWYTIKVEFAADEYVYQIIGPAGTLTESYTKEGEVLRIANLMLQAYNFSDATYPVGDSYDVYWDNVTVGPKGPIATDNCQVASVTAVRSDDEELALTDPFPVGVTTVTWTVTDTSGNSTTCEQTVTVTDDEDPVIAITSATQNAVELIGTSAVAVQGAVLITVTASDNCGLAAAPPTVIVTDALGSPTNVSATASGTGPWTYTYNVLATTANGVATIAASIKDACGNDASDDSGTFTINKNQITGTVSFSTWSTTAYSVTRDVVFKATDAGGAVLETWTVAVDFTNNTGTKIASGSYTLTDVPDATANLSAKTAWHLRKKEAAALDGDGQSVADFTLLGGDVKDDNYVNILDYSVLKLSWGTGAAGDINGDGNTFTLDYSIMKSSWFQAGDAE